MEPLTPPGPRYRNVWDNLRFWAKLVVPAVLILLAASRMFER